EDSALCLSKLRYQSLPPEPCGPDLPDPRFDNGGGGGFFCEDLPAPQLDQLLAAGALVYSLSPMLDRGLWQWSNGTGTTLTTTQGFYCGSAGCLEPPEPGFTSATYEGAILIRPRADTKPLWSCHRLARRATTSAPGSLPSSYTCDQLEGHVLIAAIPGVTAELWRYRHAFSGRFVTTTETLSWPYVAPRLEGHVIAPAL
ncbi:MAG: hypothetical protein AAGC55_14715, partial [Myxococcota bacterium]